MAKVISYKVQGTVDTEPKNLPDGLVVTKVETEIPLDVTVESVYGTTFRVREYGGDADVPLSLDIKSVNTFSGKVDISTNKLFDRENTTKLRDALTELLGDAPSVSLRKVVDKCGYFTEWFEVSPNKFINKPTRAQAAKAAAHGAVKLTYEDINRLYGIKTVTFE